MTNLEAMYTDDAPGLWCDSHRSVFCPHARNVIDARDDAPLLAEKIANSTGLLFWIALPLYPTLCVWHKVSYIPIEHPALGSIAEYIGGLDPQIRVITRILPGESVLDLANSVRENFEEEIAETVMGLMAGTEKLPRCTSVTHSMKSQRLIQEMLNPELLHQNWESADYVREQAHAALWTYTLYKTCLFCWTKTNMKDAIRVAPESGDLKHESDKDEDFSDLIPS